MKLTKIATAFAALAIAGVGTAQADSFAEAWYNLTNVKLINNTTGNAVSNGVEINVTAGANSASASGNINSAFAPPISCDSQLTRTTTGACSSGTGQAGPGGTILFNSTSAGPDAVAQGAASPNPAPTAVNPGDGKTYTYGSYALSGAVIDLPGVGPGGSTIAAGANAFSLAQVDLGAKVNPVDGNAASSIGATTSFNMVAASSIAGHFVMDYTVNYLASVINPYGSTDTANAGSSWTLTITDKGVNGLGSTLAAIFTPGFLNNTVTTKAGNSPGHFTDSGTNVSLINLLNGTPDFNLIQGNQYNFSITSQRFAFGHRDVPEPGSLALLGIGMVGLLASTMRKKKA